ncbi:alginate lyase [Alteromonas sp. V450]|uniref:polysaccharide lyase 6 family protein n=1 Tax=Alteromonas sp. V450 TaxID=1912139 RepID=UPI0008FF3468|nr:polysaccharide lyase 6 family protein [Alteromonas sp. V450]OJF69274.1 alginate lyase [Alteromonas sp. V450]
MRVRVIEFRLLVGAIFLLCSALVKAEDFFIDSKASLEKALATVEPGDEIVLKNGVYKDFEIIFSAKGSEGKPIVLRAEEKGKVLLTGQSSLSLGGAHLVVSGLIFKDGYSPSGAVISYRINKNEIANHSRVTEVVIEDYSKPDKFENDYWVALYGKHNRLDHSYLAGKRNRGVTLAVRLNSKSSIENHHLIDHNYFGYRPELGSNGGETLRIGTSHYSLENSFTHVENNVFERCNGEVEIISVKSGGNIIHGNTFIESRGTLTLRHGNNNVVTNNVFLGNGVHNTGGVRVINANQEVANNLFKSLTGYRFGSGFTVMNGVPNSPQNRYHQVDGANIHHNTFIDVEHIQFAAGADEERSAPPINSKFTNNLLLSQNAPITMSFFDDIKGIKFADNVANYSVESTVQEGFSKISNIGQTLSEDQEVGKVGASPDIVTLSRDDVGPSWYAKKQYEVPFDSGREIVVEPGVNTLFNAVAKASDGDTLILQKGNYSEEKTVVIDKTLSIKGVSQENVVLLPQRTALFEIIDNGNLKLAFLSLSGEDAPDAAGNTLLRTQKWGMMTNYRFDMRNVSVLNLNINHSYHFFAAGARSFATSVNIENSEFSNITGNILLFDKERDDLGIYNVEVLNFSNNHIEQVDGALALIYRGGTDESTFGPKVTFFKNQLERVGLGKRNKSKASIFLHGVQQALLKSNDIKSSAKVVIEHTVGEPKTSIVKNLFENTPDPKVIDFLSQGAECGCQ